ncbi:hypothetical protein AB0C98_38195 [Streptomyces sp. NPDC048558]|uniref:hypothetical protein n=1 Tax=Streptomyces sp. NPDC048558 TaxID=3155759 RepID=UPI00342DE009
MSDQWAHLSTEELIKIMPIADKEHDTWTVQTIMQVLADREPSVKQALAQWSQDPADDRLVWDVIQGVMPKSVFSRKLPLNYESVHIEAHHRDLGFGTRVVGSMFGWGQAAEVELRAMESSPGGLERIFSRSFIRMSTAPLERLDRGRQKRGDEGAGKPHGLAADVGV